MSTHARSPSAGWSWLMQAVNLGRSNPRAGFGAVALLALVALVPSFIQLALQSGLRLGTTASLAVMAACTLVMVVVYPLLIGGLLRVIDAAEHGRPTHAAALFDTFHAGNGAGRLIGFGVVMFVAYLALFVAVVALFGQDFLRGWTWRWAPRAVVWKTDRYRTRPNLWERPQPRAFEGRKPGIGKPVALAL
jgi:hypothetical protein